MMVSSVEIDTFRYTGFNVEALDDGFKIYMQNYTNSLGDITDIRKVKSRYDPHCDIKRRWY